MIRFQTIQLETIQGCNRKCWHCPNRDIEATGKLMSLDLFFRIIDQLVDMRFTGAVRPYCMNEPFMDDRMPEMMAHIRRVLPDALCVVNTNGTLLSLDLAQKLSDMGVKLRISAYDRATLERFQTAGIHTTHVTDFTNARDVLPSFFTNRGGLVEIPGRAPVTGDCQYPSVQMYVRHDGQCVLCCNDWHNAVVMGDANREWLLDIYNNERYATYREALARGQRLPPLCDQCSYRGYDD